MTSPVMQALVNVRLHEASARRGVPTHARVLAGEGAGLQSPAQLSKRRSGVVDRRPSWGQRPAARVLPPKRPRASNGTARLQDDEMGIGRNAGGQFETSFSLTTQH